MSRRNLALLIIHVLLVSFFAFDCEVESNTDVYEKCIIEATQNAVLCNSTSSCVSQGSGGIIYFKHLRKSGSFR